MNRFTFAEGQTIRIVRAGEADRFYRVIESEEAEGGNGTALTLELDVFRSNEAAFKHEIQTALNDE